jgi:hypothetical protein
MLIFTEDPCHKHLFTIIKLTDARSIDRGFYVRLQFDDLSHLPDKLRWAGDQQRCNRLWSSWSSAFLVQMKCLTASKGKLQMREIKVSISVLLSSKFHVDPNPHWNLWVGSVIPIPWIIHVYLAAVGCDRNSYRWILRNHFLPPSCVCQVT